MSLLRPVVGVTVLLWLLLGLAYPLAMVGVSQAVLPWQANGSPVYLHGRLIGSAHVGQNFKPNPLYFWGRPSATLSVSTGKPKPYNALASSPSNLGPTNAELIAHIKRRIAVLLKQTPGLRVNQIPADLVESSGSGLDPDISVQAALIQIPRVARNTHLSAQFLHRLVEASVLAPDWGMFGVARVNVLALNLRLYQALHG